MAHSTIATSPEAVRQVIQETSAELVVVEASWSAFWVADVADSLNVPCVVTSTNDPSWQWRRRRNKSERTDVAKLIAQARADQLEPVHVPGRQVREHRTAIRQRHRLVRKRTRARNAIRSLLAVARRLLVRLWARWRNWERAKEGASPHAKVQMT